MNHRRKPPARPSDQRTPRRFKARKGENQPKPHPVRSTAVFKVTPSAATTAGMPVCSISAAAYHPPEAQCQSDGARFMTAADWHIVRSGQPQMIGDQRKITGDPFQFVPLFRTHREAESYCRSSGLWHQGIRPRQNSLAAIRDQSPAAGLRILIRQAMADGVSVIGVFVGFDLDHRSCWEYFRVTSQTLGGIPDFEKLPEDERPI